MPCYVGLDVSKNYTHICVVDVKGEILLEARVETSADCIAACLRGQRRRYAKIGIEACGVASFLYEGLISHQLPVVCIESRYAHAVLRAQSNKTDRQDARGIANLMRTGMYRAVHIKTRESRHICSLLTARKLLQAKLLDVQNAIRGLLIGYGIKFEAGKLLTFEARASRAVSENQVAADVIQPLLTVRSCILAEISRLDRVLQKIAATDPVCQLLLTAPGVGALTALTFRCEIDVPHRFVRSRSIGPHLGLVPRTFQSGETERRGHISKRYGDQLRAALYCSALAILRKSTRSSWLKSWGEQVANRRGRKRATIAVARRLAVTLHQMWRAGQPFRWEVVK